MTFSTVKPSILGAQLKRRKWTEQDGKFASWSDHPWTSGHWDTGNRSGRAWAAELRLPLTLFGAGPNTEPPPGSLGLGVWGWEKRRGQEEMISTAEGPWCPFHCCHWCLTMCGNAWPKRQSGQSDISLPWTKTPSLSALNSVIHNPVATPSLFLQRLRILKLY